MNTLRWVCVLWMSLVSPQALASDAVVIAAASSLSVALEKATQGESVSLRFGASNRIAQQIEAGLNADIVVLSDPRWTDNLNTNGHIAIRHTLMSNRLVVVGRQPLQRAERIGIGAPGVPVGDYAREALAHWGLLSELADRLVTAPNAPAVLAHAEAGHVDAAIVYRSDALRAENAAISVAFDPQAHRPITYIAALTKRGAERPEAHALFQLLQSAKNRTLYGRLGFSPPADAVAADGDMPAVTIDTREPLIRSVWVALFALVASLPPAIALGWLLARRQFMGKALVNTVCLSPLVLPPVVTGWLLLKLAHGLGLGLAFTPWAAAVAAAVVGFPLLMILIRGAIESVDVRYEYQAQTLGLTAWGAFRRVTLPMALPGIAAGCVLAFARALGEFGATAMFAGDQPETTRTLALAVYAATEVPGGERAALQLVGASIAITLIALLVYERLVWRQRTQREEWS